MGTRGALGVTIACVAFAACADLGGLSGDGAPVGDDGGLDGTASSSSSSSSSSG